MIVEKRQEDVQQNLIQCQFQLQRLSAIALSNKN